ncbi:hypothetical protein BV898_06025 [Hypsibius exemplaris]|uniref:Uncharacterized protein n=1 Tax=Hypsibius exemplaris TaxID=2072580 RepID=A0A1W0WXT8_HYPEX|nr:hypothetical protein BV898_06025 [Hypsibius exemplaris]
MTGKRGRKAKNVQQQKRANTTDTSTPSAPLNAIQPNPYAHHFTAIYGQLQRISDESLRFPVVNDRLLKLLQQPNAYVTLSDLLPENRSFDSAESTPSRSSRDASPSGKKGKPTVDSLGFWLEAFTVLQLYRAYYFPDLAVPLIAYSNIIRRMVFSNRKYATKREILSLVGGLAFATKCIPAGKIFLRRLLDLAHSVTQYHHRVKLGPSFRADLEWWLNFLPLWNGQHSFLDSEWSSAFDLHLYTDAAGTIGRGAAYGNHWFQIAWPASVLALRPPIAWQEMVPVYLACLVWGKHWPSKRILFHSDNESVVAAWAKFSSLHKGVNNGVADALSRFEMDRFQELLPTADHVGLTIASDLSELRPVMEAPSPNASKISTTRPTNSSEPTWLCPPELHMELALDGSCVFA